jgi:hypothetical protein
VRSELQAIDALLAHPRVAAWLDRYPPEPATNASFDEGTHRWTVQAQKFNTIYKVKGRP